MRSVKVYESKLEGSDRRGRPLERWRDRVVGYLGERGINGREVLEEARRECWDRERWRLFCHDHPIRGYFQMERGVRAIDR